MTNETISDLNTLAGGGETLLANRYRVVRQLGQGGMGSVWLAEDTTLEKHQVAIKMLPAILLANPRSYQQIKSEALVSLRLTHPNIATLRSFEENGGNPFLVIDYVDGVTLETYIAEKGVLSEEETLRILRPVASALDYAHREKVVHRDVKPGNVMVRRDGVPFVLDFGIAREMRETLTRVTGKFSSGTLLYMSPEQLMGAAPTPAQDVYGFSAMAYECLSGHPPFHRGQVEFQILNAEPPPLAPGTPLARRILQGLAKDPAARPMSCLAVLDDAADRSANRTTSTVYPSALRLDATRMQRIPTVTTRTVVRVDADVYMLEDEERTCYEQVIAKLPMGGHPDLDDSLQKINCAHRAAGNALRHGDAEAARKLLLEVLDYPAKRRELAGELAIKAFAENRFAESFALSSAADVDRPEIRLLRGYCRQLGEGVECDPVAAREDYSMAAEAGLVEAQYNLASMLLRGVGGNIDIERAVKWYTAAAEQKLLEACRVLGALYDEGQLVPRDARKSFYYFLRAYRLGDSSLDATLGSFCAAGEDHGLNESLRRPFIMAAAAAGDEGALHLLAEERRQQEKAIPTAQVRHEEEGQAAEIRCAARRRTVRKCSRWGALLVGLGCLALLLIWGGVRGFVHDRDARRAEKARAQAAEEKRQTAELKEREELARKAQLDRLAAERRTHEEKERKVEAERLAAERRTHEEKERKVEAERVAAERRTHEEKERKAETERLAAERMSREEAERKKEKERQEAQQRAVAERKLVEKKARDEALLKLEDAQSRLTQIRRHRISDLAEVTQGMDCNGLNDLLSKLERFRMRANQSVETNMLDLIYADLDVMDADRLRIEQRVSELERMTNEIAAFRLEVASKVKERNQMLQEKATYEVERHDLEGNVVWDRVYWNWRFSEQCNSIANLPPSDFVTRGAGWRKASEMVNQAREESLGPAGYRLIAWHKGQLVTNVTFIIRGERYPRVYGILEFRDLDRWTACHEGIVICQHGNETLFGRFPREDVEWERGFRTRMVDLTTVQIRSTCRKCGFNLSALGTLLGKPDSPLFCPNCGEGILSIWYSSF